MEGRPASQAFMPNSIEVTAAVPDPRPTVPPPARRAPPSFVTSRPTPGNFTAAATIVGLLLAACVLTLIVARVDLPHIPELLVAYDAAVIILNLMTAYLLFSQFTVTGTVSVAVLATGYLVTGLLVIVNVLCFPGVFLRQDLFQVDPASPIWVYLICHVIFPASVCAYAVLDGWRRLSVPAARVNLAVSLLSALAVLIAVGVFVLVTFGVNMLPPLVVTRNFIDLQTSGLGPAAWLLNATALLLIVAGLRCRSLIQLWVGVAILASLFDMTITLYSPQRYSAGWYLSRVISVCAAGTVLAAMLHEITVLYARIARMADQLEEAAITDALTGLANRRQFNTALTREWHRARREKQPISLLMIDIDLFKGYNDRLGHLAGDDCIRNVAMALGCFMRRPTDVAARYGGEEFAVLLPGTDDPGAMTVAKYVRQAVAALGMPYPGEANKKVSISVGVATFIPAQGQAENSLIAAADEALYRAKHAGRDRIMVHETATAA